MRIFIGLVFLAAGTVWSQSTTPFQCAATASAPSVRAEGVTELVGDVVLTCTGGSPTPKGQAVPAINLTATLNTAVTSRLLANGGSEALLLIDEPNSPSHPLTPQLACPSLSGCPMTGTGGAAGEYNGSPTYNNVFQAVQRSPLAVSWLGVPIDPPGSTGSRIIRITNVRANANQLALGTVPTPPIFLAISLTTALPSPIQPQTVAHIQPGLTVGTIPSSSQQCSSPAAFKLTLTEGFPGSFKQLNAGGFQNSPGQSLPTSESGFVPLTSAGLPAGTGSVGAATTFQVTIANLSAGMTVQVPSTIQLLTSGGVAAGTAMTIANGSTLMGSNVQFVPAGSTSVQFLVAIVTANAGTPIKTLTLPISLFWSSPTVPTNIAATAGFLDSTYPQTDLFAASSSNAPVYPIWQPLDTGIVGTPSPYLTVAGIVACSSTISTLTAASASSPTFSSYSSIVTPASYNYGIVSSGPPISNITVSNDPTATWLNVSLNQTTTPATATFTVTPVPIAGNHSANVTFSSPGGNLTVPVTYNVIASPWFIRYGFGNVASYVSDAVAPGEVFVIYGGNNFGPSQLAGLTVGANGLVTNTLANTQVLFDGQAVPLYYVVDSSGVGQVAGFAPFELDGKTQTQVQVVYNNVPSPPVVVPVVPALPGLSTLDQSGGGPGAIFNQDQSVNGPANPDSVGNVITLFGTGAGQTTPAGRDGAFAGVGAPLAKLNLPVKVFIDGILATNVPYAGPAPQEVEGVFQVDVQIPANVHHPGDLSVVVQVGDEMTQPGVTVSVK